LGLSDTKGHLGVGGDADIAVYNFNVDTTDSSVEYEAVEAAFQNASYVFKDGQIAIQNGNVMAPDLRGRTFWANSSYNEELEKQVVSEVERTFKQYYSVNFENYPVQDSYVLNSAPVNGVQGASK
jgi:formylmethanofuran dehydrogenase subunit A